MRRCLVRARRFRLRFSLTTGNIDARAVIDQDAEQVHAQQRISSKEQG